MVDKFRYSILFMVVMAQLFSSCSDDCVKSERQYSYDESYLDYSYLSYYDEVEIINYENPCLFDSILSSYLINEFQNKQGYVTMPCLADTALTSVFVQDLVPQCVLDRLVKCDAVIGWTGIDIMIPRKEHEELFLEYFKVFFCGCIKISEKFNSFLFMAEGRKVKILYLVNMKGRCITTVVKLFRYSCVVKNWEMYFSQTFYNGKVFQYFEDYIADGIEKYEYFPYEYRFHRPKYEFVFDDNGQIEIR